MVNFSLPVFDRENFICINRLIQKHANICADVTYLIVSAQKQPQPRLQAPLTKYQKILIDSNRNRDLQVAVVVAVAGAHTREIWSRLPLEIAVVVENCCRVWGP